MPELRRSLMGKNDIRKGSHDGESDLSHDGGKSGRGTGKRLKETGPAAQKRLPAQSAEKEAVGQG